MHPRKRQRVLEQANIVMNVRNFLGCLTMRLKFFGSDLHYRLKHIHTSRNPF